MTQTEALKALDTALWRARAAATPTSILHIQVGHAIDALSQLKTALAQPEQNLNCKSTQARLATAWGYVKAEQKPVAWMGAHDPTDLYHRKPPQADVVPLYTTPPPVTESHKRKPMTDEQIFVIKHNWITTPFVNHLDFARAIEAAHGIKE